VPETELAYIFSSLIVPDNDFVRVKSRVIARTNKCENVASEQHFHESDTPAI